MVTENSHLDGRPDIAPSPWNQHFRIYYLTEKMRSAKDPFFSALSDRVKVGRLVEGDAEYFKSRITPCTSELSSLKSMVGNLAVSPRVDGQGLTNPTITTMILASMRLLTPCVAVNDS